VVGAFVVGVCWNVTRQVEVNSRVPCHVSSHLHNVSSHAWEPPAPSPSGAPSSFRSAHDVYVNEFAGIALAANAAGSEGTDPACVMSVPVSVLLREPRFQDVIGWFRAILTLAPSMALVMQVPFPLAVLFQSCGVAFMTAFVFVHPSRFDETLPGFSPVVSHVRLYAWNLMPCLIGLTVVYIGHYQRLRMFVVADRMAAAARTQAMQGVA